MSLFLCLETIEPLGLGHSFLTWTLEVLEVCRSQRIGRYLKLDFVYCLYIIIEDLPSGQCQFMEIRCTAFSIKAHVQMQWILANRETKLLDFR